MSETAIRVEGLSKQYRIGAPRERYQTFRDRLANMAARPYRTLRSASRNGHGAPPREAIFWALKDVSFEIQAGEVVGVIGRNGAGKSTLLKILSRITDPTEGKVVIQGRVGSLLEVGTGFHPELSGRDNIYLNGAILGMRRGEIDRKFDEIVAFSEVEKFLDTPVKHYSTGMQMRLAFAVAANLDPEILIIDEVLAVGDAAFQNKCLGKIGEVVRTGRTVLFVSHNMSAVQTLCNRAILLDGGAIVCDESPPSLAITAYHERTLSKNQEWTRHATPDSPLFFTALECTLIGEQPRHKLQIVAELQSTRTHRPAFAAFDILDHINNPLFQALPVGSAIVAAGSARKRVTALIDLPPMIPGRYHVNAWLGPHYTETFDHVKSAISFSISTSPTPDRTFPHSPDHGFAVPDSKLKIDEIHD